MINLLLGAPGGGKSYEAVAFHVLPALLSGRKVITNLPLQLAAFESIQPGISGLIDLRRPTPENPRPFATLVDYGDTWRDDNGRGPLYVIDECHFALPRGIGDKGAPRDVEEWYSMHRHQGVDVLLLTQSYRKVSANIVDLVQVVYRVRKNVAFGSMDSYVRKVQDGVRGEVLNTAVRKYEKKFFGLYQSHTQSNAAVTESIAADIRPIWRHWSVIGAALLVPVGVGSMVLAGNPMKAGMSEAPRPRPGYVAYQAPQSPPQFSAPARQMAQKPTEVTSPKLETETDIKKPDPQHPYKGYGIHIHGYVSSGDDTRVMYHFAVSQNGQPIFHQTQAELERAGYTVESLNDCAARLSYESVSFVAVCSLPQISVSPGQNFRRDRI